MSTVRFKYTFAPVDQRAGALAASLPLLSVSQYRGVIPRAELSGDGGRAADLTIYKTCQSGDIILNRMSAYNGAVGLAGQPGLVSPDYLVLRPERHIDARYLTYLIRSHWFIGEMTSRVRGIGSIDSGLVRTPRIGLSELGEIVVDIPVSNAQKTIADYLDRETAQIDAFIAKNEELITLLTERRAAVIEKAVTPTAKPSTWDVCQVRRLRPRSESGVSVNGYSVPAEANEVGVLKTGAVSKGLFDPTENKRVVEEDIERVTAPVRAGTLIVNRANTPELVGSAGHVSQDYPSLFLSDKLWQLTFISADAAFVHYWTLSSGYRSQLRTLSVGASSSMQNLSFANFLSLTIAVPPLQEQLRIVEQLNRTTDRIDSAVKVAQNSIDLARERRTALISAAVTGKINIPAMTEGAA